MDKAGYKAYLQSLGNQKHYIGRIQELLELEQELNIDLDDYIPYNDDYSKVDDLNDILPIEKLYDERLWFLINSYMNYRLSNNSSKKSDEPICGECFTFNGTEGELLSKLSTFMSETDSQSFINGFQDFTKYLKQDEFVKEIISLPKTDSETDSKMLHFLVKSSNYNINIKAITLITIALLLDIKLTLGFTSTILTLIGFNGQAIVRVDVSEGEKCLIMEAMQSKNRIINEDVFSMCNFECVHSDLNCKFQNEDKCTIKKDDIKRILDGLCDKNIFKKINDLYKYNF